LTVKQALFYNFVSAMLSLLGNIIGVALGNLTNITPWILCLIAGMFLYVALVDMVSD
jgi:zinc transporter ZupT